MKAKNVGPKVKANRIEIISDGNSEGRDGQKGRLAECQWVAGDGE